MGCTDVEEMGCVTVRREEPGPGAGAVQFI